VFNFIRLKKIFFTAICISLFTFVGCNETQNSNVEDDESKNEVSEQNSIAKNNIETPNDAKQILIDGNERFVNNKVEEKDLSDEKKTDLLENGQAPFATIITCSDSRVPPEMIFDQGLGDLFVIRVAGNVIDPVTLGSIEYGVEHANSKIVVVLGHENCGAVKATIDGGETTESIQEILDLIEPSYLKVKDTAGDDVYEECTVENVNNSVSEIKADPSIKTLIDDGKVDVVGAKYFLSTGKVEFYD
jgi:carbonic anhydrase